MPEPGRLRRRMHAIYTKRRYEWPIYDVSAYFANRESRQLHRQSQRTLTCTPAEHKVIDELERSGIAVVQCEDLMPSPVFARAVEWAERLLQRDGLRQRIQELEAGKRPTDAKSGKYYIVRVLGDTPVLDIRDPIMEITLSDAVLRIVAGYLGMFGRLAALDLWYNVPMNGPDVFSQRWHRDPEDRRIVKTFLYLRDVDEASGPFCFVPEATTGGPSRASSPRSSWAAIIRLKVRSRAVFRLSREECVQAKREPWSSVTPRDSTRVGTRLGGDATCSTRYIRRTLVRRPGRGSTVSRVCPQPTSNRRLSMLWATSRP